jgi:hypothetical protein
MRETSNVEDLVGPLNFLVTRVKEGWCARCLEYDFVTQADTLNDLYAEIQRTVLGHVMISRQSGERPFHGLKKAAKEYWDQFERSSLEVRPVPSRSGRTTLHPIELRELRVVDENAAAEVAPVLGQDDGTNRPRPDSQPGARQAPRASTRRPAPG